MNEVNIQEQGILPSGEVVFRPVGLRDGIVGGCWGYAKKSFPNGEVGREASWGLLKIIGVNPHLPRSTAGRTPSPRGGILSSNFMNFINLSADSLPRSTAGQGRLYN